MYNGLDEVNGHVLYDKYMYRMFEAFRAHNIVLDINTPRTMSSYMSLPKTVIGIGLNWLHSQDDEVSSPEISQFLA